MLRRSFLALVGLVLAPLVFAKPVAVQGYSIKGICDLANSGNPPIVWTGTVKLKAKVQFPMGYTQWYTSDDVPCTNAGYTWNFPNPVGGTAILEVQVIQCSAGSTIVTAGTWSNTAAPDNPFTYVPVSTTVISTP